MQPKGEENKSWGLNEYSALASELHDSYPTKGETPIKEIVCKLFRNRECNKNLGYDEVPTQLTTHGRRILKGKSLEGLVTNQIDVMGIHVNDTANYPH